MATTSFALNSNGRIVMLDSTSNERIRQQLQSSWFSTTANTGRDLNVSIAGTMQGENLSLSTLTIQ
ncbi:MAG TPA: hypothetical protein VFL57_21020 [Bryobacteraceae bacterium]|nr:hypothetical protein [Bryobacteraceae bacterium]